jgi:hypothetical protein
LRNPATGRCLKDTPANRRKVGLTPAPAPPARTPPAAPPAPPARTQRRPRARRAARTPEPTPATNLPRIFDHVEELKKPIPKKTGLASYLYRLFYGDTASKQQLDFLDKMSLVNNDSARWNATLLHTIVGLLYVFVRHRETACTTQYRFENAMAYTYQWITNYVESATNSDYPVMEKRLKDGTNVRLGSTNGQYGLGAAYQRCKDDRKRFMIGIILLNPGKDNAHANSLIYDMDKKELEIFEPHGSSPIDTKTDALKRDEMYKAIHADFKNHNVPVAKFYAPMDYCPLGPQAADESEASIASARMIKDKPGGYCAAWSLFYLDFRLSNPDFPRKRLLQKFAQSFGETSTSFINAYSNFILKLYDDSFDTPKFKNLSKEQKLEAITRRLDTVFDKATPPGYEMTRTEKTLGMPPVYMVFPDIEQYKKKPITKKQAEKLSLASHLYKLVYGDAATDEQLDFLDKMSLVNNDSAKWRGKNYQEFVGLLYILLRHRDIACAMHSRKMSFFGPESFFWGHQMVPKGYKSKRDDKIKGNYAKILKVSIPYALQRSYGTKNHMVVFLNSRFDLDVAYKRCQAGGKRFMIGNLALQYADEALSGHVNAILYDLEKQELEVFEPHGAENIGDFEHMMRKEMYKAIHTVFERFVPVKKFHSPMDFCPGPQSADASIPSYVNAFMIKNKPLGYCSAWSLYYLDLRLSNPDVPRKELMKGFMVRFWYKSLSFINAYSNFIMQMYEDLKANPTWNHPKSGQSEVWLSFEKRMQQVIGDDSDDD